METVCSSSDRSEEKGTPEKSSDEGTPEKINDEEG